MKQILCRRLLTSALVIAWWAVPATAQLIPDTLDRSILPVPEPERLAITELDARKAKAPPRFELKAPLTVQVR